MSLKGSITVNFSNYNHDRNVLWTNKRMLYSKLCLSSICILLFMIVFCPTVLLESEAIR